MKPTLRAAGFWLAGFVLLLALGCAGSHRAKSAATTTPEPPPPSSDCAVHLGAGGGWVELSSACGAWITFQVRAALADEAGNVSWVASTDYPAERADDDGRSVTWSGLGCGFPDLTLAWAEDGDAARLDLALALPADCPAPVRVAGAEVIHADPLMGGGMVLPDAAEKVRFLQQGANSWTFTGVIDLPDRAALPLCDGTVCPAGNNNADPAPETAGHSWWMAGLRGAEGATTAVVGALAAKVLKPRVAAWSAGASGRLGLLAIWGVTGESAPLAPGATLAADPFHVGIGLSDAAVLDAYARAAAAVTPPPAWNGPPMRGWASWYDFFAKVTEGDVTKQLPLLAAPEFAGLGLNVVQLDDGYMPAWGDWRANAKFPSGLDGLAAQIQSWGFVAGIWMAPFLAETTAPVASEHPEWFVHAPSGERLTWKMSRTRQFYLLDATHPDAAAWLAAQVRAMVDAGYGFLKLDFLYGGAYEGVRYDPAATSLTAFEAGLRTIRDAAGPDVYLLACGEPFLPSLGYFHAARFSTDIISTFPGFPIYAVGAEIARFNAARAWADRAWFRGDPDNLCVRDPLDDREAVATLAANFLGGSNLFLGDDLTALSADRTALLQSPLAEALAEVEKQAVPLDLFDASCGGVINDLVGDVLLTHRNRAPAVWLARAADGAKVLAVFAWTKEPEGASLTRAQLGLPESGTVDVLDVVTGDTSAWDDGLLTVTTPGDGVTLLRLAAR